MSWTEQQIEALKKMWGHGYSASDIAKALGEGMTRNAVIGKAHRLKLSAGPGTTVTRQEKTVSVGGSVIPTMTKVAKKRAMLRPLPPVQQPDILVKTSLPPREPTIRPIETLKKAEGIAVTKAGEHHCRWPIGDPRSPDFRFCGCKTVEGLPYCADHARIAYQSLGRKSRAGTAEAEDQELQFKKASTNIRVSE